MEDVHAPGRGAAVEREDGRSGLVPERRVNQVQSPIAIELPDMTRPARRRAFAEPPKAFVMSAPPEPHLAR